MNFKLKAKYTERELAIIGLFSLRSHVSVPEMIDAISKVSKKKPTRQAVVSAIKLMANKLAIDGYVMRRTSKIGRGAVGTYCMAKINGG